MIQQFCFLVSLDIYPKKMKTLTQKDICTPMHNSQDMETI